MSLYFLLCSVHDVVHKHLTNCRTTFKDIYEQRMGKEFNTEV